MLRRADPSPQVVQEIYWSSESPCRLLPAGRTPAYDFRTCTHRQPVAVAKAVAEDRRIQTILPKVRVTPSFLASISDLAFYRSRRLT